MVASVMKGVHHVSHSGKIAYCLYNIVGLKPLAKLTRRSYVNQNLYR